MQKKKSSVKTKKQYPEQSADVPVTQAMLYLVRDEFKADIRGVHARIDGLDAKLAGSFESLKSEMHRVALLVEEQNARNNMVMDGLTSLFDRQDRIEKRFEEISK